MFLLVCLVTDTAMYWVVRDRLGQGLDLALDASLVGSIVEEDLMRGRQQSRRAAAEAWAWDVLQRNMEGPLASSLTLRFKLTQSNDQIWAQGQAKVEAPFLLGSLAGVGRREIEVTRRLMYQGLYR